MQNPLKTAIQKQRVSPESEFIESILKCAEVYDPWRPHTETYDVSVCIGPVSSCPPAKKRVLFVLGQTASHTDLDWDVVVVTSDKARKLVLNKFGHGVCVRKLIPPVFDLDAGKRRLVDEKRGYLHASEAATYPSAGVRMLNLWGTLATRGTGDWIHGPCDWWAAKCISLFTTLEFNSLVRGGAIGYYPQWMEDGYDIQVRRHLALGGRVLCNQDKGVLGDYADLVDDIVWKPKLKDLNPTKPQVWEGTKYDYAAGILDLIGRL